MAGAFGGESESAVIETLPLKVDLEIACNFELALDDSAHTKVAIDVEQADHTVAGAERHRVGLCDGR